MNASISVTIEEMKDELVGWRRYFHSHPELSSQEYGTQAKVMMTLASLGIKTRKAAGTGVVGELCGALPGPIVAVRADIDALPISDECEQDFRSLKAGACHACGHDGHTAMLLGVAKVLVAMKERLAGTVRFVFEPTEECFPGGAMALIASGVLEGVSAIIAAHLWQPLLVGKIGISYGRLMAEPDEFHITIQGRGGHGSMPQQTIDSLLVGAQLVVALNTIVGRYINPLDPAVLSVGMFKAGSSFNVIPDSAVLSGTVRSFDVAVRDQIFAAIDQVTKGICAAAGASYQLQPILGYPPLVNDCKVAEALAAAGRETLGDSGVVAISPVMTGEDFSCYLQEVPGAMVLIGAGNPEKNLIYPHHHPKFDFDEDALGYGVEVMVRAVLKLLAE